MSRRLDKFGYMLLGAFLALGGYFFGTISNKESGLSIADKIVCRQLEIVDLQNKTVAVLGKEAEHLRNDLGIASVFRVYNTDAEEIISLGETSGAGSIVVAAKDGKTRVYLGESEDAGWVSTHGKNGEIATSLSVVKDAGIVTVRDIHNNNKAHYGHDKVGLYGENDKIRVALLDDNNGGRIFVRNRYGNTNIYLGATDSGGLIVLNEKNGETKMRLGGDNTGGYIHIMNMFGRVVSSLPR